MEKSRTTITIETDEIWIITRPRHIIRGFCRQCNRDVSMIPPEDAALLSCRDISVIYSFMDENHFHILYFNGGKPLICLNSLCSI